MRILGFQKPWFATRIMEAPQVFDLKADGFALDGGRVDLVDGKPVIKEIARVSTPGRRVYSGIKELKPVRNGLGISILSTPKGVMSDAIAREQNVGGEVLCHVF